MKIITYNSRILLDIIFIFFILVLSFSLSWFLLKGEVLETQYQDWIVHAFRVRLLELYGYTSWIHNWTNGISVWQAYQFLPHYITLFVKVVTGFSITKSMIVTTVSLFIFLRITLYFVLRLLKFSPVVSFISVIMSFSIATFWSGAKDYSLMFGYSFFPFFLFLWILYYKNRLSFVFPFVIGTTFYLHPILGMSLATLWLLGNIFSSKKLISFTAFIETVLFLIGSSLFWLPIIMAKSYTYGNIYFSTQDFISQMLKGYNFLGVSIPILLFAIISIFVRSTDKKRQWGIPLFIFSLILFILIILNSYFELPRIVNVTQFSRSSGILNISLLVLSTFLIEKIFKLKYKILRLIVIAVCTLSYVNGIEASIINAPEPKITLEDPVKTAIDKGEFFNEGRVWTPVIGSSSFYAKDNIYFPLSYNEHLDSNPMGQRIGQFFIYTNQQKSFTKSTIDTINSYLQVTGTKYVILNSENQLAKSFGEENSSNIQETRIITNQNYSYYLYIMNWDVKNAFLIDPIVFKNYSFNSFADNNRRDELDNLVLNLRNKLNFEDKEKLNIDYSKNDQLEIVLPQSIESDFLFINESYDPNWSAYLNGRQQKIYSFGPNLMVVEIDKNMNGEKNLLLKHNWNISHYISIFLILALSVSLPLMKLSLHYFKDRKILLHEIN